MNARICPLCKGRGTIYFSTQSPSVVTPSPSTSNQKANERICNVCKGKGYVEVSEERNYRQIPNEHQPSYEGNIKC